MSFAEKNVKADLCLHEHDHRELNKKKNYYCFDESVGVGLPLWLPAGVVLRDELEKLARELEFKGGYQRVVSPHIAREELYKQSGHLPYYEDSMFPAIELEKVNYRLRPMCCPHHHKIYASALRSYRDLPVRLAEHGQVYRYELSGVMSGLMRVRGLCQNDAHIYCREEQIKDEVRKVLVMYQEAYRILRIVDYRLRLSKWDPGQSEGEQKFVQAPELWAWGENILREVLVELQVPFEEEPGEAAFYGPKIDVQLKNIYGKEESASTVQLDLFSAERFGLSYVAEDGKEKRPYILHRAPLGSHERMVAFLIEKFKGAFPLWLAPVQVKVLCIADRHRAWANEVVESLRNSFVRAELDDRVESLAKKVAEAQAEQVPYVVVIGDKEVEDQSLSVRQRGEKVSRCLSMAALLPELLAQISKRSL